MKVQKTVGKHINRAQFEIGILWKLRKHEMMHICWVLERRLTYCKDLKKIRYI